MGAFAANCNRVDDPLPAGPMAGHSIKAPSCALSFPIIDPVAISIGPFAIRWYALAYVAGLLGGWFYAKRLAAKADLWGSLRQPKATDVDDLIVWVALGVVLGGRIGYVLFYNLGSYLSRPLEILAVWHGGMSFHGGFLGAVLAIVLFARWRGLNPLAMLDMAAVVTPIGLFFGRIANFINGELWGRPAPDFPYAVVFPHAGPEPRHPSQLYEAFGEGLILFIVMAIAARRLRLPPARPPRRHLRAGLCGCPHRLRVLPRARRAARLPLRLLGRGSRRRHHHGHAALDPHGPRRRRRHRHGGAGLYAAGKAGRGRVKPLADTLSEIIAHDGPITVERYMSLCLRHYYATRDPLGAAGDFTTAPEISQMFGELIGLWMMEVWHAMGRPAPCRLVELGPGRGTLMADLLRATRAPARLQGGRHRPSRGDEPGPAAAAAGRPRLLRLRP